MIAVGDRVYNHGTGLVGEVVAIDWPFGTPDESAFAEPHFVVLTDGAPWPDSVGESALVLETDRPADADAQDTMG